MRSVQAGASLASSFQSVHFGLTVIRFERDIQVYLSSAWHLGEKAMFLKAGVHLRSSKESCTADEFIPLALMSRTQHLRSSQFFFSAECPCSTLLYCLNVLAHYCSCKSLRSANVLWLILSCSLAVLIVSTSVETIKTGYSDPGKHSVIFKV